MLNLLQHLTELEAAAGSGVPPYHTTATSGDPFAVWVCSLDTNNGPTWEKLPDGETLIVPYAKRPNTSAPRLLCDTAEYVLGHYDEGDRKAFAAKNHKAFMEQIAAYIKGGAVPEPVRIVLRFLETNPKAPEGMTANDVVAFRTYPKPMDPTTHGWIVHQIPDVAAYWTDTKNGSVLSDNVRTCCSCGRSRKPVRLVGDWLRGVPGALMGSCALVSANIRSAQRLSVGTQAEQAGLCFECASSSHKALNAVLARPIVRVGPMVVAAWPVDAVGDYDSEPYGDTRKAIAGYLDGVIDTNHDEAPSGRVRVLYMAAHQARAIVRRYEEIDAVQLAANARAFWTRGLGPNDTNNVGNDNQSGRVTMTDLIVAAHPPTVQPTLAAADQFVSAILFGDPVPRDMKQAAQKLLARPPEYV